MSVHVQLLSNRNLNLLFRIYSGVPNDAPAYIHRLDFDAVCLASIKPRSKLAWLYAYHGKITAKDYIDIGEALYKKVGITEVMYERAAGYVVHLVRRGDREWKRVPTTRKMTLLAANFSGMPEE